MEGLRGKDMKGTSLIFFLIWIGCCWGQQYGTENEIQELFTPRPHEEDPTTGPANTEDPDLDGSGTSSAGDGKPKLHSGETTSVKTSTSTESYTTGSIFFFFFLIFHFILLSLNHFYSVHKHVKNSVTNIWYCEYKYYSSCIVLYLFI